MKAKPTPHHTDTAPLLIVGRAFRGAPEGALGGFIQSKLRTYEEPTRAGTRKGDPIGLSRQKFHALLLDRLTCLDWKAIAREVGVSHGLARKWSTESEFQGAFENIRVEFLEGPFTHAAIASALLLWRNDKHSIVQIALGSTPAVARATAKAEAHSLVGLDDAGFYSPNIVIAADCTRWGKALALRIALDKRDKKGKGPDWAWLTEADRALAWAYAMDAVARRVNTNRRYAKLRPTFSTQRHENHKEVAFLVALAARQRPISKPAHAFILKASMTLHTMLAP